MFAFQKRSTLPTLVLCVLFGFCFSARAQQPVSDMKMETICLGRLVVSLPVQREMTDRSGKLDDVAVEVLLPVMETESALNRERLALMQSAGSDVSVIGNEQHRGAVWLASYRLSTSMDEPSAVRALRLDAGATIRLDSVGDSAHISEISTAVANVAHALEPLPESGPPPAGSFCFADGYGAVIPYGGYYEGVDVLYALPGIGTLNIITHSNGDELPEPLSEIVATGNSDLQTVTGKAPKVLVLPEASNTQFNGNAAIASDGRPTRLLIWRYQGKTRAAYDPFIEVRLRTDRPAGVPEAVFAEIVKSLARRAR